MQISESANAHGVNADKQRSFTDGCVTDPTMFRVMSVMTASIRLHIELVVAFAANYYINIFLKSQELLKLNLFGCIINLDNYACGDCSCLYVLSKIKNPHNHTYKIFRVGDGVDREININ